MSAKVHLHMSVSDLAKSREFYERFLGDCRSKFHREIARYQLRKLGAAGG